MSANFLMRKYLECSLWPHPTRARCDTACAGRSHHYKSVKMSCHRVPTSCSMLESIDRQTCVLAWAYWLEFQEGSRKHVSEAATRDYHGTGMPCVRIVFWCSDGIKDSGLSRWLRADLAHHFPRLNVAVLRIQCLDEPEPTRLFLSEETHWDGTTPVLRRSAEEVSAGVLPHLAPQCLSGICNSHVPLHL